jgi:hypothetical protein
MIAGNLGLYGSRRRIASICELYDMRLKLVKKTIDNMNQCRV